MTVRFVKEIAAKLGDKNYTLAQKLGVSVQLVDRWTGKVKEARDQRGMRLDALCKLRKLANLTWNQLGKMLDDEFSEDEK